MLGDLEPLVYLYQAGATSTHISVLAAILARHLQQQLKLKNKL